MVLPFEQIAVRNLRFFYFSLAPGAGAGEFDPPSRCLETERHLLDEGSQKSFSLPLHQASKDPWHLGGLCGPVQAGTLVEI